MKIISSSHLSSEPKSFLDEGLKSTADPRAKESGAGNGGERVCAVAVAGAGKVSNPSLFLIEPSGIGGVRAPEIKNPAKTRRNSVMY